MKIFLILISLLIISSVNSQNVNYKWETGYLCFYESCYDSTIYSKKQIDDCYKITFRSSFLRDLPFNYKFENDFIDTLEIVYNKKQKLIKSLYLPNNTYWNERRNTALNDLTEIYNLSVIYCKSISNPEILKDFNYIDNCLKKHADALIIGGDSLLNDWHYITNLQANQNAYPDTVWKEYNFQLNSNDKFFYARKRVQTFGWWSCAVKYLDINKRLRTDYYKKNEEEFMKLFIENKLIFCD
jgi:hypothetical protein